MEIRSIFDKVKSFDLEKIFSHWWNKQPVTAKVALFSGFIIGFISHIFIYTNRYFGDHDVGLHFSIEPMRQTGRWFNTIINRLSYGYIMPLIVGIFVTLFLSLSAFYICKIFNIEKKMSAILISALLTTFPSIAFTNLFLYDSANYHFGVLLAVFAVYITLKYKIGFVIGAILLMFTLAIYQSKYNIAFALCVFYLIKLALDRDFSFKNIKTLILKFFLMSALGGLMYAISLAISFQRHNMTFGGHRGFSPDSVASRLLSISGFISELSRTYREFVNSFRGSIYIVVNPLLYAYLILAGLASVLLFCVVIKCNIHRQPLRLLFILGLLFLIPFASNFAGFLAINTVGTMIYPFVLTIVAFVILFDCHGGGAMRSVMVICVLFISANYVISNNAFYLRAFFFNQTLTSINTRISDRIDSFLPLIESRPRQVTYFGSLPNEYFPYSPPFFNEHGTRHGGRALSHNPFILPRGDAAWRRDVFVRNLQGLHGINLNSLPDGSERNEIQEYLLTSNMPVWPAEGSVAIINDVIVINFGIADVIFNEDTSHFHARHWISEGHASHDYEYEWLIYRNEVYFHSTITNIPELFLDVMPDENYYNVRVIIRNTTIGFSYPVVSIIIPIESDED